MFGVHFDVVVVAVDFVIFCAERHASFATSLNIINQFLHCICHNIELVFVLFFVKLLFEFSKSSVDFGTENFSFAVISCC